MDSILATVRAALGIEENYDGFDTEIKAAINSSIFALSQIGIGPSGGYSITSIGETWTDLFDGVSNLEGVKSFVILKTRLEFDPPNTSFVIEALNQQIKELEWRLAVEVDPDYVSP